MASKLDPKRTTPFGLLRYAREFTQAAQLVVQASPGTFSTAAHFLASHSIELSLKAFLSGRGVPLDELAFKYGHKLDELLDKALSLKLTRILSINADEQSTIRMLGQHHSAQRFRYIETGTFAVPPWMMVTVVSFKLSHGLEKFCYRKTFGRRRPTSLSADDDQGAVPSPRGN